ncbi:C13 family peptidase [Methylomonas sp. AM2-LC]|uniref:C13 family peptidase n=1 Tax=Methylomonas sp. AM2-LC TaxID=3153301 RepID=UPI003267C8CD
MLQLLKDCKTNLVLGFRIAVFRKCSVEQFVVNTDQVVLLLLLDFLLNLVFGYVAALPRPVFVEFALPTYCYSQLLFYLGIYLVLKLWKESALFLALCVTTLSISWLFSPLLIYIHVLEVKQTADIVIRILPIVIGIYYLVVLYKAIFIVASHKKLLTLAVLIAGLAPIIWSSNYFEFDEFDYFWNSAPEKEVDEPNPYAKFEAIDAEQLMYQQPKLLDAALQQMQPQRDGYTDLFFIGFAGYAMQDVFSKEVTYAKELMDMQFDTLGHSINLINNIATHDSLPLANASNLSITLKHIGSIINPAEDVLFLYLSSHGSKDHKLSVQFWPLALNDISPEKLRTMLDEAGIKWRVIIISSCYSGGFIDALQNENTLIATAAAADKTSFGCSDDVDFTYFGEALFKDTLPHEKSVVYALQTAQKLINAREKLESLDPSQPQLVVGQAITPKLDALAAALTLAK